MLQLDYDTGQAESAPFPSVTLIVVPPLTFGLSFFSVRHNGIEEPFGIFEWSDVLVQVGGPVLVTTLWVAWGYMAFKRRLTPLIAAPVLCWAALNVLQMVWLGLSYFEEPWTQPIEP